MSHETTEAKIIQPPTGPNLTYGKPAVTPNGPPQSVIVNQVRPDDFKVDPIALKCQFCGKMVTTKVKKDINICACLLCYCTCLLFYICVQLCRGKSLCCWNAEHRCPQCGNVVGTYSAC